MSKKLPRGKQGVCITPNCGRQRSVRGLCARCYVTAQKHISRCEATWESLVELGLILPRSKTKTESPFGAAFTAAIEKSKEKESSDEV